MNESDGDSVLKFHIPTLVCTFDQFNLCCSVAHSPSFPFFRVTVEWFIFFWICAVRQALVYLLLHIPLHFLHEAGLVSTGLWWTLSCRWIFVYVWMSGDLCVYFRPIPFLLYYYYLFGYLIVFLPLALDWASYYILVFVDLIVCFGPNWCILGFLSKLCLCPSFFPFPFLFSTFYFLFFISFFSLFLENIWFWFHSFMAFNLMSEWLELTLI